VLDAKTGAVRPLFAPGAGATVRDPDVSFDAKRILFSMRRGKTDDYHIYAMNADGTALRQLTAAPEVSDIDPIWLPDGDILFSSTREPKYCMCNRHIMCNLYRMKPDACEHPSDRQIHAVRRTRLADAGRPRAVRPLGVRRPKLRRRARASGLQSGRYGHALYWGNNTTSPGGVIDARTLSRNSQVDCDPGLVPRSPWGALGLIDRTKGVMA
jgi:hypothetical protein